MNSVQKRRLVGITGSNQAYNPCVIWKLYTCLTNSTEVLNMKSGNAHDVPPQRTVFSRLLHGTAIHIPDVDGFANHFHIQPKNPSRICLSILGVYAIP